MTFATERYFNLVYQVSSCLKDKAVAIHKSLDRGFFLVVLLTSVVISGCGTPNYPSDSPPTLSIANATVAEGGTSGTTNLVFTVSLSAVSTTAASVNFTTSNGTALAGSDYVVSNGTLTIAAGSASGTISVAVLGDAVSEPLETLTLRLSNPVAATIATATAIGTINNFAAPTLSIAHASVVEGSTLGTTILNFNASLSSAIANAVTVDFTTSDGTALSASDYTATTATLTIPAGNTTGTISVSIGADATQFEASETFTLSLSNAVNAVLGVAVATGSILNDDAGELNDTGIVLWGNVSSNALVVTQPTFPLQDADKGRDVNPAQNSNTDGKLGFSFIKLDAAGTPLSNQAVAYATTPWPCVLDQTTGLMWEVKTPATAGGLHDASNTYSWYNSTGVDDGGVAGSLNAGVCSGGIGCDTESYVAAVNAASLCGYSDWRLPKKETLRSIVDYSIAPPGPATEVSYFPNAAGNKYWSSSPSAVPIATVFIDAWAIDFNSGSSAVQGKSVGSAVRLVRGGL